MIDKLESGSSVSSCKVREIVQALWEDMSSTVPKFVRRINLESYIYTCSQCTSKQ
jgi:hypothetical protein